MCARSLVKVAALLAVPLGWGLSPHGAAAIDRVANTATYAPGSIGYYSAPAFNASPSYFSVPYYGRGYRNFASPYLGSPFYGLYGGGFAYPAYLGPTYYNSNTLVNYQGLPPYSTGYSPAPGNNPAWGRSPLWNSVEAPEPPVSAATITVRVPAYADVWFDGQQTRQTGSVRQFVTPDLNPGVTYRYEVKASWLENGKLVSDTQYLSIQAGDRSSVIFVPGPTVQTVGGRPAAPAKRPKPAAK
jgi:uncharacterized protein (TIGR03000 family)